MSFAANVVLFGVLMICSPSGNGSDLPAATHGLTPATAGGRRETGPRAAVPGYPPDRQGSSREP